MLKKPSKSSNGRRKIRRRIALGILFVLLVGFAVILINQNRESKNRVALLETLLQQFKIAADGMPIAENVFGGTIVVKRSPDGRVNVVASGVPDTDCVNVAFLLSKTGVIVINQTFIARISSASLSKMCNSNGDGNEDNNTISWSPHKDK